MTETTEEQLGAAHAEIERLTAGASDEPRNPGTWLTPGQWIQMWNEGSAEDRLRWASTVLANSQAVDEYFRLNYKARALNAEAERDQLKVAAQAEIRAATRWMAEVNQAEATIARVRAALDAADWGGPDRADVIAEIRAVLDQPGHAERIVRGTP